MLNCQHRLRFWVRKCAIIFLHKVLHWNCQEIIRFVILMTFQQIQKLLSLAQYAPEEEQNEIANLLTEAAIQHPETEGALRFTQKDYLKMPRKFRQLFKTQGLTARVYRRKTSAKLKHYNYEIRLRSDGYNIYACADNLTEAKQKFIQKLNEYEKLGEEQTAVPSTFSKFTEYFFDKFYSRKVSGSTLRVAKNQFKNHLSPYFKDTTLKRITPNVCQELIDRLEAEGKGKTAEDIHSLLNIIFKAAIKHGLITNNPIDMVVHNKHEREHGKALTKDEERLLLSSTAGSPYQLMFAIALYTGLRPNEYKTARIEGNFIVANNSKRKNGKVELKKIPVTPMLKPYIDGVTEFHFTRLEQIRNQFNKILPGHRLYDLRTTFYTRCMECGIADAAIKKFVGHTLGGLADTYADLPDEFLFREGQKLLY